MMKTSTLLTASAVVTIALATTIGIFIQHEDNFLRPAIGTPQPLDAAAFEDETLSQGNGAELLPKSKPEFGIDAETSSVASTVAQVTERAFSPFPAALVEHGNRNTASATAAATEPFPQAPAVSFPAVLRWVRHPKAQIRLATLAHSPALHTAEPTLDSIIKNAPAPLAEAEATVTKAKTVIPAPVTTAVSAPLAGTPLMELDQPHESHWPTGPFSVEEERYRAQYGWAAFSEVLRDEALGPAEP